MQSIAQACSMKREYSVQEEKYHIMPELWLRKTFPVVVFADINLPEKRLRVCFDESKIKDLPEISTDI